MTARHRILFVALLCSLLGTLLVTCKARRETSGLASGTNEASLYNVGNRNVKFQGDRFLSEVQPILASRCASCHGCTDAPCGAKMTSREMLLRGANKLNPYAVHASETTHPEDRLGAPGFFPVLNNKLSDNMLFQLVNAGKKNTTDADPAGAFNLAATQAQRRGYEESKTYDCPANASELASYLTKNPMGGMPLGLARLSDDEHQTLQTWVAEEGGTSINSQAMAELQRPSQPQVIRDWEAYLNHTAPMAGGKRSLVARYLYEHWFNAHIAFDEMPGEFYRIVRTTKTPGPHPQEPEEIITQLPTDDPKVENFYYRFKKITDVIVQKNHIVFALNAAKIKSTQELFEPADVPWKVTKFPNYASADPFQNFKDIPGVLRHRFMLENAHYIADSMVRAPVCVGESATYAIADHFWVFFLKPEFDPSSGAQTKMSDEGFAGLNLDVVSWTAAGQIEDRFVRNYTYLNAYEKALRADLSRRGKPGLDLNDLWGGEPLRAGGPGKDRNAWLSITRHDTSTTVQYGIEGGFPQSLWVLNYANFERLYYNLVVNFKYWGGIKHKLGTWRSMSHERLDGEDLFLSLLPQNDRARVRDEWSGGLELGSDLDGLGPVISKLIEFHTGVNVAKKSITRYIDLYPLQSSTGTPRPGIKVAGKERAEIEVTRLIRDKMVAGGVSAARDPLNARADGETIYWAGNVGQTKVDLTNINSFAAWENALAAVTADRGIKRFAAWLPATTYIRVQGGGETRMYTSLGNRGYKSHNIWALSSSKQGSPTRVPERDTVSIYRGIVGDHPEIFLDISLDGGANSATEFLKLVQGMQANNYRAVFDQIKAKYGIAQNSSKFWPFVDWLHSWMLVNDSDSGKGIVYAGVLDLSRYNLGRQ